MQYTGWLSTLNDETRERVFVAMRSIRAKSDYYINKGNSLRALSGHIAVGGADFDEFVRGEALASYLRAIGKGLSPTEALAVAIEEAHAMVKNHNPKRKDINWARWEGTADNVIEYQHKTLVDAVVNR